MTLLGFRSPSLCLHPTQRRKIRRPLAERTLTLGAVISTRRHLVADAPSNMGLC
jgi:hypothetical protein